ncbi:hypothetical protein SKTS_11020 [Sulfurimicrobium lacus]|uniref:YtkA-like domain-containing protein n=1 Tax=Sulfurimicrobium lacus TaxID=2715678 RepID=A0A6F8VB36_9PROT|nr:hypothetical protein [Sulfurimicrobium lacus]BCB26216.1 hypothetical protein SKTS_11020 [Sulfurimicrobium lacus]
MKHIQMRMLQLGLLTLFLACYAHLAAAQGGDWNRVVDGINIHLGVQPAEMVQGAAKTPQGKSAAASDRYHLVVVLFDASSGKPVDGAQVKTSVAQIGLSSERRTMEPLHAKNSANYYGNFFTMLPGMGPYRIVVEISGVKDHGRMETTFEYNP